MVALKWALSQLGTNRNSGWIRFRLDFWLKNPDPVLVRFQTDLLEFYRIFWNFSNLHLSLLIFQSATQDTGIITNDHQNTLIRLKPDPLTGRFICIDKAKNVSLPLSTSDPVQIPICRMQPTSRGPILMSHDNLCGQPISRVIVSPLYNHITIQNWSLGRPYRWLTRVSWLRPANQGIAFMSHDELCG